jgi:hypothetical protein
MSDEENLPERSVVMSRDELIYAMRLRGLSPSDIAQELNTTSADIRQVISRRIKAEAADLTDEERSSLLAMENARYDFYLAKLWPQIEYGDTKAIQTALQVSAMRMKANQLDKPTSVQTQNVLVLGGESQEYIEGLKSMINDKEEA